MMNWPTKALLGDVLYPLLSTKLYGAAEFLRESDR